MQFIDCDWTQHDYSYCKVIYIHDFCRQAAAHGHTKQYYQSPRIFSYTHRQNTDFITGILDINIFKYNLQFRQNLKIVHTIRNEIEIHIDVKVIAGDNKSYHLV